MRPYLLYAAIALGLIGPSAGPVWAKESVVPRVAANNTAGLMKLAGQRVAVHGKVQKATISKSGHHFLNFYGSTFSAVCFQRELSKFDSGGPAKLWANKEIEVSGKLEIYRGKPQIKLTSADQVRLSKPLLTEKDPESKVRSYSLDDIRVDSSKAEKADSGSQTKFELKQTGKSTWVSPAGLIYHGKDPQGLTRVEHVLRHAADQPNRRGSHGVFDGGNDQALATVDEAWKIAKAKKIRPKQEGDRLAYTIPMGRRIGFLGGTTGARQNHPALKNVFIVIRKNSEVVTAFPR